MQKRRWYDKHPEFAHHLELLKHLPRERAQIIFEEIRLIMQEREPDLIEEHIEEFPLSLNKRRWYDKEPYSWIIVNALKFSKDETLDLISDFLKKRLNES